MKNCKQATLYCRSDMLCLFCNNTLLPACSQSSMECTPSCACAAQHAFPAHSTCAGMAYVCARAQDGIIPHWPNMSPKTYYLEVALDNITAASAGCTPASLEGEREYFLEFNSALGKSNIFFMTMCSCPSNYSSYVIKVAICKN